MILLIIPVSDRHNLLSGGGSSRQECYREGIQYGHEWIWHLVKLVNAGGGSSGWDGSGCQWDDQTRRLDGKSGGSEQRRRTIPVPVEMEPYGWRGECYRAKKKLFFIIWNAKMCLIRNFASRTKMKSHDMNWDGMLDCYRIANAAWWKNNYFL